MEDIELYGEDQRIDTEQTEEGVRLPHHIHELFWSNIASFNNRIDQERK